VNCTAIDEEGEEEGGGKRNILQKTPNKKYYSLRNFFATRRDWVR
jgi:hypothetical protein